MPIGNFGAEESLDIRQGATFGPINATLTNPDASPVNIIGWMFRGQVRRSPTATLTPGATFEFTITNAAQGQFTFSISDEQTTLLQADPLGPDAPASQYVYDIEAELPDGRVLALIFGTARVQREVTKVEP